MAYQYLNIQTTADWRSDPMWLHILIFVAGIVFGGIWIGYAASRFFHHWYQSFTFSSWPKWQIFLYDLCWPALVGRRAIATISEAIRFRRNDLRWWWKERREKHRATRENPLNSGGKKR